MTELSFLIDLLLNHELKKETKDAVASRIKEVEQGLVSRPITIAHTSSNRDAPAQAASTIAAMARHEGVSPIAPAQTPIIEPHIDGNMRQKSLEAAMRARKIGK